MTSQAQKIKVGTRVLCNGYTGTVREVHDGTLKGMASVRLDRGEVCVSLSALEPLNNKVA